MRRRRPTGRNQTRRSAKEREYLALRACELFFDHKKSFREIAYLLTKEEGPSKPEVGTTEVYALLREARDKGFIVLDVKPAKELEEKLARAYQLGLGTRVHVPDAPFGSSSGHLVAERAARVTMNLMKEFQARGCEPVGLGLGAGRFSFDFSKAMSRVLRTASHPPKIRLHAITAAASPQEPQYSAMSCFHLYPARLVSGYVGLFTEPFVRADKFAKMIQEAQRESQGLHPEFGFLHAYRERKNINLVVTSLGDPSKPTDLYRRFLELVGVDVDEFLRTHQIEGNIQYRPYGSDRVVDERPREYRPCTLFEIADYQELARHGGVVLMVRRGPGDESRAKALLPLLESQKLRGVFTDLVLDPATCQELIDLKSNPPAAAT